MIERILPHKNIESEIKKSEKSVIIMYPDSRTTGGQYITPENIDGTLEAIFLYTVNKMLSKYSRQGYDIKGIIYQDTFPNNFSPIYPISQFDQLIPLPVSALEWKSNKHKEYLEAIYEILQIKEKSTVVVGGYHSSDCVQVMTSFLRDKKHAAKPNLLLTNALGEVILEHEIRKYIPKSLKKDDKNLFPSYWKSLYKEFELNIQKKNI